jgi:hypothetical protein
MAVVCMLVVNKCERCATDFTLSLTLQLHVCWCTACYSTAMCRPVNASVQSGTLRHEAQQTVTSSTTGTSTDATNSSTSAAASTTAISSDSITAFLRYTKLNTHVNLRCNVLNLLYQPFIAYTCIILEAYYMTTYSITHAHVNVMFCVYTHTGM